MLQGAARKKVVKDLQTLMTIETGGWAVRDK